MTADAEIRSGARFAFGANWARFLSKLDEQRIVAAQQALQEMLCLPSLEGMTFLDIGSGSGLSSLAARRLGATVRSFDFDPQSVACTHELKRRYFPEDERWHIEQGSALDNEYLQTLGEFDIVYSWGVLYHTGSMWVAIENAIQRVKSDGGRLFIAIYNDQGLKSHLWWIVKWLYNRLPRWLRPLFVFSVITLVRILVILKYTFRLEPMTAIRPLLTDRRERGMSGKYDVVDWIGGLPYEFATLESLQRYLASRGFSAIAVRPCTSLGCHELALRRNAQGVR